MTPQQWVELARAIVLIVMRDLVIPGFGIYLTVWLAQHDLFAPWQLPLLAGMMCVPLVARAANGEGDDAA